MNGTELEKLVARLEAMLIPAGFGVETRERVFGPEGQVAEFDIVLTGRVGSSTIRCLIECRDRPSEGAAPASWIEQLVGRRDRFRFEKVIAVSTTGFAPGATDYARQSGVELRTAREISAQFLFMWFTTKRVTVTHREMRTEWVSLVLLEEEDRAAYDQAVRLFAAEGPKAPLLHRDQLDKPTSAHDVAFAIIMASKDLWPSKAELSNVWTKDVGVEFRFPLSKRWYINTDAGRVFVTRIKFKGTLVSKHETLSFTRIAEYANELTGETIGRSATAHVELPHTTATVALNNVIGAQSETLAVHVDDTRDVKCTWVAFIDD